MQIPDESPEAAALIQRQTQGALSSRSPDVGSAPSAKGLMAGDNGSFNSGLAYGDNPTLSAIRARTSQSLNDMDAKVQFDSKIKAKEAYFNKLATATKLATDEANLNFQREMAKRQARLAKKAQRGAMLGTILGITGAVGGGVAGGPGGAMAGAQGGAALGNYAGQEGM